MLTQVRVAMCAQAKLLLRLAEAVDVERGTNRGDIPDALNKRAGAPLGSPWCASTWATLYQVARGVTGSKPAFQAGASTSENVKAARKRGKLTVNPLPGDAACFVGDEYGTGYNHTAMVLIPPDKNGDYTVIGGNQSNSVTMLQRNLVRNPAVFITVE